MDMQKLFRRPILAIAENDRVEALVRRSGGALVRRFVAGATLEEAMTQIQRLYGLGLTATLDVLGENVTSPEEAKKAAETYVSVLSELHKGGYEPNISVKLTMLGLDFSDEMAMDNLRPVLAKAQEVNGFVRIDMEGSAYTERTIRITETLHDELPGVVGTVIQAMLYRSGDDVDRLMKKNIRIRLVKGAYAEPETIAYQSKREVDAAYRRLLLKLLDGGNYPAIATHDPALIQLTKDHAARQGLSPDAFEFQMLYGIRRDEQLNLVRQGYRVRIYVPFGTEWYPYYTRRIAERPANALFVLRQLISRG